MNREAISIALFNQLQTAGATFKLYNRHPVLWDQCPTYPALYMGSTRENATYNNQSTALQLNEIYFQIGLYVVTNLDPNIVPDTIFNNLLDAVDSALAPPVWQQDQQTLGGLVSYARREGAVEKKPGYLDGQGELWFEIKVLVPD